jgi:nucleotide-binding universal stress UspA family protein
MKKTILVAVDFTPVSYNALTYACELSKNQTTEIIAVHLLDENITGQFHAGKNLAVRKMAERMYQEILLKTKNDLDNFLSGLRNAYGDIIRPVISHGTIYEAFNEVASKFDSSMIVMGTHGIIGMQSVFGSRAYKVVAKTYHPFLIVQDNTYKPFHNMYMVFKDMERLQNFSEDLLVFSGYFTGKFILNTLSGELTGTDQLPENLRSIADRTTLICEKPGDSNIVDRAIAHGADALGICIDEMDNFTDETYGMTQDKILANKENLPVYCLPASASL